MSEAQPQEITCPQFNADETREICNAYIASTNICGLGSGPRLKEVRLQAFEDAVAQCPRNNTTVGQAACMVTCEFGKEVSAIRASRVRRRTE